MNLETALPNQYGDTLRPYGIQTSRADRYAYVCPDSHREIGRKIHVFDTRRGKRLCEMMAQINAPFKWGTSPTGRPETGAGFLHSPGDLECDEYDLTPFWRFDRKMTPADSVDVVKALLSWLGYTDIRYAEPHEQIDQIDLIATAIMTETWEVKMRGEQQSHSQLFIQTHECNPERNYG